MGGRKSRGKILGHSRRVSKGTILVASSEEGIESRTAGGGSA